MSKPAYIFFNGEYVPPEDAKVSVLTHALHYSTSCFEGIRANWSSDHEKLYGFRMEEHYERLRYSASILKIKLGYTPRELCEITETLIQKCGYRQDVYIRPMAYKSSETLVNLNLDSLEDGLMIAAFPVGDYLETGKPISCTTSSWTKPPDTAVPSSTKIAGVYTTNMLAKTDALGKGFDEAILLAHNGNVSEGSGENIFLVADGVLHTPQGGDNCLMGITRDSVIKVAQEVFSLSVCERSILRSELYKADEVFLTGTAAHITAVGEVDKRKIGDGSLGPITKKLQETYFKAIRGEVQSGSMEPWCWPIAV